MKLVLIGTLSPMATGPGHWWYVFSPPLTARSTAQVEMFLYQLGQAEMLSQGGRQYQPSVGHQAGVVEGEVDAVELVDW